MIANPKISDMINLLNSFMERNGDVLIKFYDDDYRQAVGISFERIRIHKVDEYGNESDHQKALAVNFEFAEESAVE